MKTGRMEAFSDGVIAIIITIMVLELKAPHSPNAAGLVPLIPAISSYALSFIFLGIYWSNHHHLLQVVQHVGGGSLWANLHLLFWLSLVPFTTDFMGENHFAAFPVALYGINLLLSAMAYYILVRVLIAEHEANTALAQAVGNDFKGKISMVLYGVALAACYFYAGVALAIYVLVAVMWLVPDRRMESALQGPLETP
jgi:uncharacterized membrane protein